MRRADLEQLFARLERPMYNVAFRWTWNEADAHELVQVAFTRLWSMRRRVDLARLEPLVWRILVNLAASHARRRRRWRWVTLDAIRFHAAPSEGGEARLLDAERLARVRRALESLPAESRRVVVLSECAGLSYAEIGRVLDLPEGTVGSRRHRALNRLRRELEREQADDPTTAGRSA